MVRKLNEEAVSPVIAVILMVAITVVLAATVFVLVADISGNTAKQAPQISWRDDQEADTVTVVQVSNPTTWGQLVVVGCTAPAPGDAVDPGDQLTACSGRVTISHQASGTLLYEKSF